MRSTVDNHFGYKPIRVEEAFGMMKPSGMSQRAVDHLVRTFVLRAPSLPITGLAAWSEGEELFIEVRMMVAPRDDPGSSRKIPLSRTTSVRLDLRGLSEGAFRRVDEIMRQMIRDVLLHELDEGLFVGGERRWDPHANEPKEP